VEGYKIGPGDSAVHLGPFPTNGKGGGGPLSGGLIVVRLQNSDLYVDDVASDNITHFVINRETCLLIHDPVLYPSGDTKIGDGDPLAIAPDGQTMFIASTGDNRIYSHTIEADGSLGTAYLEKSPSQAPTGIAVSPDGHTLVISYLSHLQVCAYPISSGHLGTPNCQSRVRYPTGVAIDPASTCVYAAEGSIDSAAQVVAFTLTDGLLGPPVNYNHFGPGLDAEGIMVSWNDAVIYVTNPYSSTLTIGTIGAGCRLKYRDNVFDGDGHPLDFPGGVAQARIAHGYVVTGNHDFTGSATMGIFRAYTDGKLVAINGGLGQFPLLNEGFPFSIAVIGSE
jgi:DNA-binding beta-propeller fold protein YncE